jgi:mannose-1-phosphate guanylyltransferase/mannose-6-phosphate isomerase
LYPKQFLPLVNHKTLFQDTIERALALKDAGTPVVLCNDEHRFMAAEQLRDMNVESRIILEPMSRNTAPAAAIAALCCLEDTENESILLVLPADHNISDRTSFAKAVEEGGNLAKAGRLVAFGIEPKTPETGYGYIEKGSSIEPGPGSGVGGFEISRFVEKPDIKTARGFVESGSHFWNSGMFMFGARSFLEELEKYDPQMVAYCREAWSNGVKDLDFMRLASDAFAAIEGDSIDYAVMEKTGKGAMVPYRSDWSDVGSWSALWEISKDQDENGNAFSGDVLTHDVKNSYLRSSSRLIAGIGLDDMIVVETKDAVMICPKGRVQDVKLLVDRLKAEGRDEALMHTKVYRPWGAYETMDLGNRFQVKRITVKPGAKLSLQKHHHRAEHWVVVKGTAIVTRGEERLILKEDESTYIPLGYAHRLENPGRIPLELIEVQTGSYLGEDDIVRMDDIYGRNEQKGK